MELKIKNLAKIEEANIKFDGITVIAGENNAGKSTIGKALFAIFYSMYCMEEKIETERENALFHKCYLLFQNMMLENGYPPTESRTRGRLWAKRFSEEIMKSRETSDGVIEIEKIYEFLEKNRLKYKETENFADDLQENTVSLLRITDEMVMKEVISRTFQRIFDGQISPLVENSPTTELTLVIKGKRIQLHFENNSCVDWNSQVNILNEAFCVDNPFIVDQMSDNIYKSYKATEINLLQKLCKEEEDSVSGVFGTVLAREKLKEIYEMLDSVIDGEIVSNIDGEYYLNSNKFKEPLNVKNLSAGIKSFAVLKQLLEKNALKEKDILILDEPEIHLHPEWQLVYAELIVLLQVKFDLTLVITTHSPYFLDAIDIYTQKYKVSNKVHYYLAENSSEMSVLRDVTTNIDEIYLKLSDPMQKLENMRNMYYTSEE